MESEEEVQKSRSQVKREFQELKELVKQLVELPADHLRRLPLSQRNLDEILAAQDLSRSALQRQLRYLVRRIEKTDDVAAIQSAFDGPIPDRPVDSGADEAEPQEPEPQEVWAEALIAGDDEVLGEFIEEHPDVDHRKLRKLVRRAMKEKERGKAKPTAAPKLVAFLRRLHSAEDNDGA